MISPLVSIALCTYNGDKFLEEQLDSLINQTYQNIEIIIIDDFSSDQTIEIIKRYVAKFETIHLHQNEVNLGYVKNFEKAIGLCNGEFIALCDQDDIWAHEKINLLFNNIENNALIYHDSEFIDGKGTPLRKNLSERLNMYEGSSSCPFFFYNSVSGHSIMFRKSLIGSILPFNENYYHDWQIAIIATAHGGIKYLNQTLVKYRQHELSNTDFLRIKTKRAKKNKLTNLNWLKFVQSKLKNDFYLAEIISCLNDYDKVKIVSRMKLFQILLKNYNLLFYMKKKHPLFKKFKAFKISFF